MKKINKLIIFNLMFISFFIGINFVNAATGHGAAISGGGSGGFSSGSGGGSTNQYIILEQSPVVGFRVTLVDDNGKPLIKKSINFIANRGDSNLVVNGILHVNKKLKDNAVSRVQIINNRKGYVSFDDYTSRYSFTCYYCPTLNLLSSGGGDYGTWSTNRAKYNYQDFISSMKNTYSIENLNYWTRNENIMETTITNDDVLKGNYSTVANYFNNLNNKGYSKINEFTKTYFKKSIESLGCGDADEMYLLIEPMITINKEAEYWFGTVTELSVFMNGKSNEGISSASYNDMGRFLFAYKEKYAGKYITFKDGKLTGKFKGLKSLSSEYAKATKGKLNGTSSGYKQAFGTGIVWISAVTSACKDNGNTCGDYKEYNTKTKAGKTRSSEKWPWYTYNGLDSKTLGANPSDAQIKKECFEEKKCIDYKDKPGFSGTFIGDNANKILKNNRKNDDGVKVTVQKFCYDDKVTEYNCSSDFKNASDDSKYSIKSGGTFNLTAYNSIPNDEDEVRMRYLETCPCKCNDSVEIIESGCNITSGTWNEDTYEGLEKNASEYKESYNIACHPCESFDDPDGDGIDKGTEACSSKNTKTSCKDLNRFNNTANYSGNMLQIKACLSTLSNGTYTSVKNFSETYGVPAICKEDYVINYNAATFSMGINTSFGIAKYLNFNSDNNRVSAEATRTCWLDESNAADFVENETVPTSIYWDTDYFHTTTAVNELHDGAGLGFSQSGGDKTRTGTITVNYSNGSSQQFKVSPTYISSTNTIIYGDVDFDSTSSYNPNKYEPNMSPYSAPANADNEDNSDIRVSYKMADNKSMIYYKIEKNNNNITNWYWSTNQADGVNYTFYPLGSSDGNAYPTLSMSTDENALKRVGRIYLKYNDGSLKEYVVKPDPISGENHFYKEIEIKPNAAANTISKSTNADGSTNLGITAFYSYAVYQDNEVNNFLSEKDNKSDYYPKAPDLGFDYYEKVRNQSFRVDSTNYLNPTVNLNENSITTTVRYNYIPTTSFAIDLVKAEFQYDPNQSSDTFKDPTRKVEKSEYSYITPVKSTEFSKTSTNTTGSAFESKSNASDKGNVRKIGPSDTDGHVFPIRFSTGYNKNGYEYLMWVESYNMNEKALNYKASYNQANNNECPNQYACNYLVSDNDCKKNLSKCETICDKTNLYCEEVCYCTDDPNDPNKPNTPRNPNDGVNFVYTSISTDTVLDKKTTTAIGENWLTEKGEKTIKEIEETSHKGETFDDANALYIIKLDTELINYIKSQTGKQYVTSPICTGTYKADGKVIPDLYYCKSTFLDELKSKKSENITNKITYDAYYDSSTGTYSAWK